MLLDKYNRQYLEMKSMPDAKWMLEYRNEHSPGYNDEGIRKEWPTDKYGPKATRAEIEAWNRERKELLKQDDELRKAQREQLNHESFGADTKKVKIDFKGATFTLASNDEAGIARIMKMINE